MCGRYALYGPMSRLREAMLLAECPEYGERYNTAPQASILVVRDKPGTRRVGQMAKWSLVPASAKDPAIGARLNNARGETVAEKHAFRSSFARHRCLIPANGFYEWQPVRGFSRQRP
jgi:putative SOS response-associated peptidase YedK